MDKIKNAFRSFMKGRYGTDELNTTMLITALILMIVSSIFGIWLLNTLSTVLYVFCIFRIFSRNTVARASENHKFLTMSQNMATNTRQWSVRLKNSKKYKYFRCPECKAMLRLPRKVGEVTVTCGKCKHSFKKKA